MVNRDFALLGPDRLWVADLTYISTWSGWVYVAFVVDAYGRRILGRRLRIEDDHCAGAECAGAEAGGAELRTVVEVRSDAALALAALPDQG